MPQWRLTTNKDTVIHIYVSCNDRIQQLFLESRCVHVKDNRVFYRFCNCIWYRGTYVYLRISSWYEHNCGKIETLSNALYRNPETLIWLPPATYNGVDVAILFYSNALKVPTPKQRDDFLETIIKNKSINDPKRKYRVTQSYYDGLIRYFKKRPFRIDPNYLDCKFEFTEDLTHNNVDSDRRVDEPVLCLEMGDGPEGYEMYKTLTLEN